MIEKKVKRIKPKLVAPYMVEGYEMGSIEEVDAHLASLEVFTVDCETTPQDEWRDYDGAGLDEHTSKVVMLQVGDEYQQWVIDTRFVDISLLYKHLQDPTKIKVGVNLKFDYKQILESFGVRLQNLYDCMLAEMLINEGLSTPKGFYSLQSMSKRYAGYEYSYKEQLALWDDMVLKKNIRNEFHSVGMKPFTKSQIAYGAADVVLPLIIKAKQMDVIHEYALESCVSLENKYLEVLAEMEWNGFYLDIDLWEANEAEYRKELDKATKALSDYLLNNDLEEFIDINWNSSQQVVVLFEKIGVPVHIIDRDKSTDSKTVYKKSVAETHIAKYKKKFDLIPLYLEYKHLAKLVSTYGTKFLSNINPKTGRVHSNYYQILNTGRIASSKPNLQNIPGDKRPGFREAFIPSKSSNILVVSDYSSQESRVLASIASESAMIKFFLSDDTDMHSYTARRMFGVHVQKEIRDENDNIIQEGVNEHLRFQGKVLNFSIAYGASDHKLQDTFQVPKSQARDMINKFYKSYPELKPYFTRVQASTVKRGYILIDNVTMRRAYHPQQEVFDFISNMKKRWDACGWQIPYQYYKEYSKILGELKRNSQNWPIQGTSGSMTKLAGIIFFQWIKEENLFNEVKMVNMVHDEIVVECTKDLANLVASKLKYSMEEAGSVFVSQIPMTANPEIASYWTH